MLVWFAAGTALAATVTLSAPMVEAQTGGMVDVPIQLADANGLGAVHWELTYDPRVLAVDQVTKGALAGNNALMEANTKQPGRVVVGLVSLDGMTGEGVLATARFKVVGGAGLATDLMLTNNQAWERESHAEVLVNATAGKVTVAGGLPSWLMPVAIAAAAGLLVLLLFWFLLGRRRKQSAPAYATARVAPSSAAYRAPTSSPPSNVPPTKANVTSSAPPMELPESHKPAASVTNTAAYKSAEEAYFKLKGQAATGRITHEQFEAQLRELMVQDAQGRYWMLGADSGKWYRRDGETWTEAQPY